MSLREDSAVLRELAHMCKDAREKERLRALYVLSLGCPLSDVEKYFCVDESTLRRWILRWESDKNLADKPREGRPPLLDEKDKEELKELIQENNPKKHGLNASTWDTRELVEYFKGRGKEVSRECIRKALKSMGASYVKAQIVYSEADEEERSKFAEQFLKDMQQKPDSVVVLFQDEMSAGCNPHKGYGWTFEKRLEIQVPQTNRQRLNCFGAVNPLKGEVLQMSSKESKSGAYITFLKKALNKYPRRHIWMYADNLRVHKSRKVKQFLEKHPNLELRFLPPYSPDLNLQEEWWNYERTKLLNNRCFETTHELATNISWFGKQTLPEQITSICNITQIERILR